MKIRSAVVNLRRDTFSLVRVRFAPRQRHFAQGFEKMEELQ